jgi:circadian clock protein KaiC
MSIKRSRASARKALPKAPTGISGFDAITGGGLPAGRPTLICGGPGCGKTLFAVTFLANGISLYDQPGVLVTFEERISEVADNVVSLGFDLNRLVEEGKLFIDYVHVDSSEIEETGEYDLEGLFVRLGHAIDKVGAKRIVLDTMEVLFTGLRNTSVLRTELRRLFAWLKDKGVTAVITAERGTGSLTRNGLEEYVSDCVILLDNRVQNELSTRRLRVLKYRGSAHGSNEYPFLIDAKGISVLPVTAISLEHGASEDRVSTGVPEIDEMLGGHGYFRGSSVYVSGSAGTGKSSLAAHFADASARAGERCLYFSFEESPEQIERNMRSIGLDLSRWRKRGLLDFHSVRPTLYGLETHLATFQRAIDDFQPRAIVVDPLSSLLAMGSPTEVRSALLRVVDMVKSAGITGFFTSLNEVGSNAIDLGVSSLMDTWLTVRDIENGGERNRGLYVIKSRGMAHSNQIREFLITDQGVRLQHVYIGPAGVLTGSARVAQEAAEEEAVVERAHEFERQQRDLIRRHQLAEAQIIALRADAEAAAVELERLAEARRAREEKDRNDRDRMAVSRKAAWTEKKS